MADPVSEVLKRLTAWFDALGEAAIAVSGGVDSMTLAHIAAGSSARVQMFHAVSPAVPTHATDRVKAHAAQAGWDLAIVGAGEFNDPDYLRNPVNRCYFCKTNLYGRLAAETDAVISAGTNTDDLGEYRPGLTAASEHRVRHPYVETDVDKAMVRKLAAHLGLDDLAELPAQPCLASRVETGLPILANELTLIDRIERHVAEAIGPGDIRARMTHDGVVLELPPERLDRATELSARVAADVTAAGHRWAGMRPYRRGSAFLTGDAT
jgi:uncharacterized protein